MPGQQPIRSFSAVSWETLDWEALDRLRALFLEGAQPGVAYWQTRADLANYEFTFAQRIGWKWDAVLRELRLRRWTPPAATILDWGCGSGIAARRVIEFFGPERSNLLLLFDRSSLAMDFAADMALEAFPMLRVERADPAWLGGTEPVGMLVVSHVLNELSQNERLQLLRLSARADAVLWVESGTRADSRELVAVREELREQFDVIAPCTHQAACGLLAPENERHWCHHFAAPPPAIMADSDWVRFAQRAGIDLRSLPYSFLVLERRGARVKAAGALGQPVSVEGYSRILGAPRIYKASVKILSCQSDGVRELELQKRDAPAFFKQCKQRAQAAINKWEISSNRIKGATGLERG